MRVLLFGVDGLAFGILNPLMERGLLPTFQHMRENGVHGVLESVTPPMTPPAWVSMYTGLPPAQHGVYDFWDYETRDDGLRARVVTQRKGGKAVWNVLSEYGKRVVVANVPLTYPPEPVNGLMLSGYMAPDMHANVTYPVSFKEELLEAVPDYQIDLDPAVAGGQLGDPLAETLRMTRARIEMLRLVLCKPWDFCFVTFVGADRIQHLRWDAIAAYDPEAIEYYRMLDDALALALDALGPDDMLMVVSDHGFQGARRKFYIQEYLYQQGLLRMGHGHTRFQSRAAGAARWLTGAVGLQSLARQIRLQLRQRGVLAVEREHHLAHLPDFNWAITRAWIPSSSGSIAGYADIFLDDRIEEQELAELASALLNLHDPQTGMPLADAVYREAVFGSGPFAPPERHLLLLAGPRIALPTEMGRPSLWETSDVSAGIHHPDGVLCIYGAQVKPGAMIGRTHLYDIVPTVLARMGVPPPPGLVGTVVEEAFDVSAPLKSAQEGAVARKLRELTSRKASGAYSS